MRKLILAALMGATVLPSAAMAQNRELYRDRQDIREERRDLGDAYRYGDRRDIRDERSDYRDARREYRDDRRDYRHDEHGRDDWRGWRDHNRDLYRGGGWRSEYRYTLPQPRWGQRWVRRYDDVLLVDVRSGYVVQVVRNFYR